RGRAAAAGARPGCGARRGGRAAPGRARPRAGGGAPGHTGRSAARPAPRPPAPARPPPGADESMTIDTSPIPFAPGQRPAAARVPGVDPQDAEQPAAALFVLAVAQADQGGPVGQLGVGRLLADLLVQLPQLLQVALDLAGPVPQADGLVLPAAAEQA